MKPVALPREAVHQAGANLGNFLPNAWGLYDMLGNGLQWVEDCYNASYQRAPFDGSAWRSGNCHRRVLRGGSWTSGPSDLRAASRGSGAQDQRLANVGFRLARILSDARPRQVEVLNKAPPIGSLRAYQSVLVDDGFCPKERIKEIIAGDNDQTPVVPRRTSCITRD
jgi:Sulfatase-modifying factor enzyme 1